MSEKEKANPFDSAFNRILNIMAGIAGAIVTFAMLNSTMGVIARTFFNRPIGWTSEFNAYALLYITYLSAAWILFHEGHVIIGVATQYLKPRPAAFLKAVTSVFGAIVYFIITYFAVNVTWKSFVMKYPVQATVLIPKYTIQIIIPIGCFVLAAQFLRRARDAYRLSKKQD